MIYAYLIFTVGGLIGHFGDFVCRWLNQQNSRCVRVPLVHDARLGQISTRGQTVDVISSYVKRFE